ncbi:MAG: lipoyl(octanoyl) transferase LipB [Arsenophonus endosymbiont of Ceratovacuna japonica]
MLKKIIVLRKFGIHLYKPIFFAMNQFIKKRTINTLDELWLVEHYPVFTLGKSGKIKHIIKSENIPIIQSDRGGQITYHGPGQQIMYILLDLKRNKISAKKLISIMENTVISTLKEIGINSYSLKEAPGIYVKEKKICSLGLRIHKSYSSHGLALNINMNLTPFHNINPCGYSGIKMTQINDLIPSIKIEYIKSLLIKNFCKLSNFQIGK